MRKRITGTIQAAHKRGPRGPRRALPGAAPRSRTRAPTPASAPSAELLRALNEQLLQVPDGFTAAPEAVRPARAPAEDASTTGGIDWGQAEALAFASLLREGEPIRLTGQDSERGTFAHRHRCCTTSRTATATARCSTCPARRPRSRCFNSPLSENACLGFEYGYSITAPDLLDLWEAQFGDFANGAQVIIDQFIAAGRAKWGQTTRLDAAPAARLRGQRARALLGAARALPGARRRRQPADRQRDHAGAVLPPAALAGTAADAPAAGGDDAEEPAALKRRHQHARRPGRRDVPAPDRRRLGAGLEARTSSASCSAPARSTTTSSATPTGPRPTPRRSPGPSSCTRSRRRSWRRCWPATRTSRR